jgi:hypothetical protein
MLPSVTAPEQCVITANTIDSNPAFAITFLKIMLYIRRSGNQNKTLFNTRTALKDLESR